jgi:rare lipoprotein A (peptidoglycan hydrolase)
LDQRAALTEAVTNVASSAEIVGPTAADTAPPETEQTAAPAPPPPKPPVRRAAARHAAKTKLADMGDDAQRADRHRLSETGGGEQKMVQVQTVGPRQVGSAAWYGGRYVGRRTSSGERLDRVHATAAHRDLPLNTLVRVTNLDNGRSVVVRITDC